jgi:TolA-binding protein
VAGAANTRRRRTGLGRPAPWPAAPQAVAAGRRRVGAASGDRQGSYQAAFELLKDSQYDQAIAAFQKFLVTYPDSRWRTTRSTGWARRTT